MGKLTVNRGTTFTIDIVYQKNSEPASLAGATIRFTVKTAEWDDDNDDSTAIIVKNVTSHTDPVGGLSMITLDPADTATLEPTKYYYDIKVEEVDSTVYKIDEGRLTLDGSPTNRLT